MNRLYRSAYIFFWLLSAHCVSAQLRDLKFRHIDVQNGLPASSVNVIVKDSLGYIWIGTRNGLCRYDGFNYTLYQHDYQHASSLPDNNIISLIVTRDNQLWISTPKGVCSFDRNSGQFTQLVLPAYMPQKNLTTAKIFLQDRNGYIWFEEYLNGGLVGFNPVSGDYKKIDFFNHDGAREVNSMYEDVKGNFWISRYKAVYYYQPATGMFKKIDAQQNNSGVHPNIITAFSEAADGSMWFTTWGGGLEHYVPATGHTDAYLVEPTAQLNGTKNVMNSPVWIRDKHTGKTNLWMMSEYGVLCFDTLAQKFHLYKPDIYDPYANKIQFAVSRFPGSFFDPAQNMLWCWGPMGIDICDFDMQPIQTFHTLTELTDTQTGSIDGFINNMADPDEYFISCFARNTLMIYNESKGTIDIKKTPAADGIPVIFQPSADLVWMSSKNTVWEWNRRNGTFTKINRLLGMQENPANSYRINCYLKDSHGIIWLGSRGGGLGRFDLSLRKSEWKNSLQQTTDNKVSFPKNIIQLTETATGHMYGLDYTRGLFEFSSAGEIIHWFSIPGSLLTATVKNPLLFTFNGMAADKKGGLWLNTNNGLIRFDTHTQVYLISNKAHLLPWGIPESMATDKYGYLWLSYTDQLAVFDPVRYRVRLFSFRNGYQGSPDGCTFLLNFKNELRIGYENHIESVQGDPFEKSVYKLPKVLLNHVVSNSNNIAADLYDHRQNIEISYKNNNLEMEYALPLYHNPDEIIYSYRLQGYEASWNNAGKTHIAKYTNLPGGNYHFEVKAFDPGSGLYSEVTSVAVVVYPPFWKTAWFIVLTTLLLFGIVYLAYRYRLNQLLRLERMRIAISSDLHDEVGSTLSSISIYSNVARQMAGVNREESNKYLERIETSSREMIDSMSDIVWSINPANDDPVKIVQRMRMHAYEVLGAAGINLHWQEAATLNIRKMKMDRRKNFYLIFKEGINNAAKYAAATDIFVDIKTTHNHLFLTIRDNGTGFDLDAGNHTGNGLKNMHLRSRLLKGQIKIISSPGNGTQIQLIFPVG